MKKRFFVMLVAVAVAVAFMPASAFAGSSKVKMTVYSQVIKSGNTLYCAGEGNSIYKVGLKNGKVNSIKELRRGDWAMGSFSYIGSMKKKGNYLYYVHSSEGAMWSVLRINIKTGKDYFLTYGSPYYAIKGKKLYVEMYNENDNGDYRPKFRVMKLNGKSKKKTSKRPSVKEKKSNAKGYSVKYTESGDYAFSYLKTPKGTFYLGKTLMD